MSTDAAKLAEIGARLRQAGKGRAGLARWVQRNRAWIEHNLRSTGTGWAALGEAMVESGAVPAPYGWAAEDPAVRQLARRRLADALRQAWRRERARRPGAGTVRLARPTAPPAPPPDVFVSPVAPARLPADAPSPPAAGEDDDDARIKRMMDQRSGRR
jgi:hypothetical protein